MRSNNKKPNFSLDDFRRWMRNSGDDAQQEINRPSSNLIGVTVESKIDEDRIQAKMEVKDGYPEDLAIDFFENGGIIADVDGKRFLIEVHSGSFLIHRAYIKRSY